MENSPLSSYSVDGDRQSLDDEKKRAVVRLGQELLSRTPAIFWVTALAVVLLFHCSHLVRMRGEQRWYHCAHVVMLLGMLYMFAEAAFRLRFAPPLAWWITYVATSAAILLWVAIKAARRESLDKLWAAAFAQQAAMVYMWTPMRFWLPLLSYGFTLYFAAEIMVWVMSARQKFKSVATAERPVCEDCIGLEPRSVSGDVCMTIMAGSMAYMFVAMQLMAPLAQMAERPSAQSSRAPPPPTTPESASSSLRTAPEQAPTASANPRPESYAIVAGDTLARISKKAYGSERDWGRIVEANPGLDPRRLRIGQIIALPAASPSTSKR